MIERVSVKLPSRERLAELVQRRHSARLAQAARSFNWRFWRWRPKVTLASLMALALFGGSVFLICLHWQPWVRVQVLSGHAGLVDSLSFSGDGQMLASGGADKIARVWDLRTGQQRAEMKHLCPVQVALSPDGEYLVTTGFAQPALGWNAITGEFIREFRVSGFGIYGGYRALPAGAAFSGDGRQILTYAPCGSLVLYARYNKSWQGIRSYPELYSARFYGGDEKRIVASTQDGKVIVFNHYGKPLSSLTGFGNTFRCASVSPDGQRIVASAFDSTATLWHVGNDQEKSLLSAQKKSDGGEKLMWYAKQKAKLKGHDQFVLSARFSDDGERVLTASLDGTVRVWDGRDGRMLSLLASGKPLRTAIFSPDNMRIACAGPDGSIEVWQRRRREGLIGLVDFPGVWLAVVFFPLLVFSLIRDQHDLKRAGAAVPADTPPA